jgi:hypothetical protein
MVIHGPDSVMKEDFMITDLEQKHDRGDSVKMDKRKRR